LFIHRDHCWQKADRYATICYNGFFFCYRWESLSVRKQMSGLYLN
jgi:hypothetical protein